MDKYPIIAIPVTWNTSFSKLLHVSAIKCQYISMFSILISNTMTAINKTI